MQARCSLSSMYSRYSMQARCNVSAIHGWILFSEHNTHIVSVSSFLRQFLMFEDDVIKSY